MKRILLLCLTALLSVIAYDVSAQERTVTGKVTAQEDGSPLPGVNVVVKGTTTGTVTDGDGNFTLNVPSGGTALVFTFIGLQSQEAEIGTRSTFDIQMASDVTQLSEVVVTALGTQKNAKEIVYANQTVSAKDLLSAPNKNALEALRGKTAGVKLTTGSGSVGASTRIVLRGEASLTGDNNALIVIDGVPIDNSSAFGGEQEGEGGYADFGNRFNDFNPENIESVTILKGPAATSLYGSRGASGVVLITSKSGSRDNFTVNFNSTSSFERAYVLLQRQDQYGQGLIDASGGNTFDSGENFSWGPKFDGVVRPWTSPVDTDGDGDFEFLSRPYSKVDNQLQDFFNTGSTFNNSLSFSGGGEKFTYYLNYGNTSQNGVLENTDYERHNLTVNTSGKLSNKIRTRLSLNYSFVDQNTAEEGSRAFEGRNPYANAVQAPVNIPYNELRNYKSPYHDLNGFYGSYALNPYFLLGEYLNNAKSNNFLGSISLDYSPIKNLTLSTTLGTNYVGFNRATGIPTYQYSDHYIWEDNLTLTPRGGRQNNAGFYEEYLSSSEVQDLTGRINYNTGIIEKLNLNATVGMNYNDIRKRILIGETQGGFAIPDVFNLGNSIDNPIVTQNHFARRYIGAFANLAFGWDEKAFLEYSARNDWSSTLPENSASFFYQSLGANVIVSDYLDLNDNPVLNYFKFRASVGTSGKDAQPYYLSSVFTTNQVLVDYQDIYKIQGPLAGQPTATRNGRIGNPSLTPELTTTFEIGGDFALLKNKIQLEYTYYHSTHSKQIVLAELSRSSGFTETPVNIGEMTNQGHEVGLTFTPIDLNNGLKWVVNLTWAANRNMVNKISDDTDELTIWDSGRGVTQVAKVGHPFGSWKTAVPKMTPDGRPIVGTNGSQAYTTEAFVVDNNQPKWNAGLNSTLTYKGIRFGFLFDTRQGGTFYSMTKSATEFNGTSLSSTFNDRMPYLIPNSVQEVVAEDGTISYVENTKTVGIDAYVDDGNYGRHILDQSYIKLREVTLGYAIPNSVLSKVKIKQATISLFARNPKVWVADENTYADPEVNGPVGSTDNASGVESTQIPLNRSYGVTLNLTL